MKLRSSSKLLKYQQDFYQKGTPKRWSFCPVSKTFDGVFFKKVHVNCVQYQFLVSTAAFSSINQSDFLSSHVNFEINAWKINNKIELIHNTGLGKIYCEISNGCTLRILFRHFLSHSNFRSRRARISIRCDVLLMKMLNVKKKTKTNQLLNNKNNNDHCFVDEQRKMINEPFFHFFRGTYTALGLKQSGVTC